MDFSPSVCSDIVIEPWISSETFIWFLNPQHTFIWWLHSHGMVSLVVSFCRPFDIFGTLELVYFSISKKSLVTVIFPLEEYVVVCILVWCTICPGRFFIPQ